jgi:predicted HAD superfamily phosphohydrolase YqeG
VKREFFFEEVTTDFKNRIVFLDVDGTLTNDSSDFFDSKVLRKILMLKKSNQLYLCTNSKNIERNTLIEKNIKLKIINIKYKKPSKKILEELNLNNFKNIVVIGDKWLTDGLFAKNIDADFIKVKRKISGNENFKIKLFNYFDDLLGSFLFLQIFPLILLLLLISFCINHFSGAFCG